MMKFALHDRPHAVPRRTGSARLRARSLGAVLVVLILCCAAPPGHADDPGLSVTDWPGVQRRVQAARGKVVVVQIWTMTCPRCRQDLPEIVQRLSDVPPERVEWIAVNCDFDGVAGKPPEWYQPRIRAFIGKHPGRIVHLQLDQPFLDFLEQQELDSTPAYYVYGPGGELARRFPGETDAEVDLETVWRTVSLEQPGTDE